MSYGIPARIVLAAGFVAFVFCGGTGCKKLEDRLISAKPQVRASAISELAELQPEESGQLIQILVGNVQSHPDLESKVFAVEALAAIGDSAMPAIIRLCGDKESDRLVHMAALDSFVSVGLLRSGPKTISRYGADALDATTMVFDDTTRSIDVREKASIAIAAFGGPAIPTLLERALRFDGPASELALRRTTELAQADESAFNTIATRISEEVLAADEDRVENSLAALKGLGDGALPILIDTAGKQGPESTARLQKFFVASPDAYLPVLIQLIKDGEHVEFASAGISLIGKTAVPAVKNALVTALGSDPNETWSHTAVLHGLLRKGLGSEGRQALIAIMNEYPEGAGVSIAFSMVNNFLDRCQDKCVKQQSQGGVSINGASVGAYICDKMFDQTLGRVVADAKYGQHRVAYESGFMKSSDYRLMVSGYVSGIKSVAGYLCNGVQQPPDIAWKLYLMN